MAGEETSKRNGALRDELLVFGFIRESELSDNLYMNIPVGINKFIISFMPPRILKFDLYNIDKWKLMGDDFIITRKNDDISNRCQGYFTYPESYHGNKGMRKGIHFWSVKAKNVHDCYRYIGVSTIRCYEYTQFGKHGASYGWDDKWDKKDNHFLYVEGGYQNWKETEQETEEETEGEETVIFTVKLDCDNWICTWYKNDKMHKLSPIQPNKGYFFIGQFCADRAEYHSVETPHDLQ